MNDATPHHPDLPDVPVHALLGVIRDAIEASGRFTEENAVGNYQCMTLFVSDADGLEMTVSVTNPEQFDD